MSFVQFRNQTRPSNGTAVVILLIDVFWLALKVLKPLLGVEVFVAKNVIESSVIVVGAGFGGETLDATGSAAELGGDGRGRHFEFLECFGWRGRLVKGGTAHPSGGAR